MNSHAYHPPEQEHLILKDDCLRCAEHAEAPWFTMDRERVMDLVTMALAWEDGGEGRGPESNAERAACQSILDMLNAMRAMFGLPNRFAVVLACEVERRDLPREPLGAHCVECGDPMYRDDEPLKVGDGWACSSECEAMHNLREANGPADVLAAADVAYGEGCEFVLRIVDRWAGETLCSHLARNDRSRLGIYMAEDLDDRDLSINPCYVERAEVVG